MDLSLKLLSIFALIVAAAYFAISEISLAGSRRVRLTQMAEARSGSHQSAGKTGTVFLCYSNRH